MDFPIRAVLLFGSRSPYGCAHFEPLLADRRFRIVAVVTPSVSRYRRFETTISRDDISSSEGHLSRFIRRLHRLCRGEYSGADLAKFVTRIVAGSNGFEYNLSFERQCEQQHIPYWVAEDVNSESFLEKIRLLAPDICIAAAYPQLFGSAILGLPPLGCINSHPSLLPRCRGAHPIFWAIASGEKETGLTFHQMVRQIDAGPILVQIAFPIEDADDYSTIYARSVSFVPKLVAALGDYFESEHRCAQPQDPDRATYFRQDKEIDHLIDWNKSAREIWNLVRAANGQAYFLSNGSTVLVTACQVGKYVGQSNAPDGTVLGISSDIIVKVKDGVLIFTRWKLRSGYSFVPVIGEKL